jgi:hypothetical protein
MRNTRKSGQILRSKNHPRSTLRSGRGSQTNCNTSQQIQVRVIEVDSPSVVVYGGADMPLTGPIPAPRFGSSHRLLHRCKLQCLHGADRRRISPARARRPRTEGYGYSELGPLSWAQKSPEHSPLHCSSARQVQGILERLGSKSSVGPPLE